MFNFKKTNINLIPDTPNTSADYYCTWQTQLFASNNKGLPEQRLAINEQSLFGNSPYLGWAYYYEDAREDLMFVLDDGWDVPPSNDTLYYGSLILNSDKFPSFNLGNNTDALKSLQEAVTRVGWKGLGLWICAQESQLINPDNNYWETKIKEADYAKTAYWKVDWGNKDKDLEFRKELTHLAEKFASGLCIENAMINEAIPFSMVFRTYDVPAIMSIPITMKKLEDIFSNKMECNVEKGIINCEDEVYIAAAGGFTMGVMRHPNPGDLPDGTPDSSFPAMHRNIKTKIAEVIRAAKWHRIAPAFGGNDDVHISKKLLIDSWKFENSNAEIEKWWFENPIVKDNLKNDILTSTAPAYISRGLELPIVTPDENLDVPYVVASKNPNGAVSVVTAGRTNLRDYYIPKCNVEIKSGNATVFGIFGSYSSLTLLTTLNTDNVQILAQDLADKFAFDITEDVIINENKLTVPGDVIEAIGTIAQDENDTSEPGMILKILYK